MIATVRLYYDTGFNSKNIPDEPALLNGSGFSYTDFESNYELQNNYINSCTIEATWDDVKSADYLRLDNAYFFITDRTMLNENACMLSLQVDALTTLGGPENLTYSGGVINRAHALTDDLFGNCVEEDITPLEPLKVNQAINWANTDQEVSDGYDLVGSTLQLDDANITLDADGHLNLNTDAQKAYTFQGSIGGQDYQVTKPEVPKQAVKTVIRIDGRQGSIPGVGLYSYYGATANIKYLRMIDCTGSILYCYYLPVKFAGQTTANITWNGNHADLIATSLVQPVNGPTFLRADYTPRNNKVLAMYNTTRLSWSLSGDQLIIDTSRLYSTGMTTPSIKIRQDPQVGGSYIAQFGHVDGKGTFLTQYAIKGAPWRMTPIAFTAPAGETYMNNDYIIAKNNAENEYWRENGNWGGIKAMAQGAGQGLIGGLGGALFGALLGGGQHLGNLLREGLSGGATLNNQLTELQYNLDKKKITYPELSTQPMNGLGSVFGEGLTCEMIGPTVNDLARFDSYFDLYGYAMGGTPFNKNYLSGRQYCNYIEATDIHITSGYIDWGLPIKTEAERQLNNGVRIWHVKPQPIASNPRV